MSYKGKLLAKGMQLEWVVQESEDDIYGQSAAPRLWVSEPADDQNLQTLLSDHLLSLSSLATFYHNARTSTVMVFKAYLPGCQELQRKMVVGMMIQEA
ncbi:hypothetical protein L6164_025933 [Bauhinia variegata]|uniref:Uncharacterized protein n=1 Tax=Bauhinia variegata TaxID=167791 RepID=A0ACB9M214_BAUVA|nr:hypothetical protein L6164_025933 [Bauhinia variegata]